jgi:hypothetical protein
MRVEVQAVHQATDELAEAARRLLPQLSGSAALDAGDLARIVGHQAITFLVARAERGIVGMLTLVTYPLPSGCGHGSKMWSWTGTPAAMASVRP